VWCLHFWETWEDADQHWRKIANKTNYTSTQRDFAFESTHGI